MKEFNEQEFNKKWEEAPPELHSIAVSLETIGSIKEIAKRFSLNINQMGELADEIGFVLIGMTHPKEFVANLETRLAISREIAGQVASAVNESIFLKAREAILALHGEKSEGSATAPESAPSKEEILSTIEAPELSKSREQALKRTLLVEHQEIESAEPSRESVLRDLEQPLSEQNSFCPTAPSSIPHSTDLIKKCQTKNMSKI